MQAGWFSFLFSIFTLSLSAQENADSLLRVLDKVVQNSGKYEARKKQTIASVKKQLAVPGLSPEEEYRINSQLSDEYEAYICDSARHYLNRNITIATRLRNADRVNETKLRKARVLAASGLYGEGIGVLQTLDKKALSQTGLADYYQVFGNIYLYHAEYAQDREYMPEYLKKSRAYRDSVLLFTSPETYQYAITKGGWLADCGRAEEAENLLKHFMAKVSSETREYAVTSSILAFIYQCNHSPELRKEYLIKSAIADIKGVVKENNSLRTLAELLFEEGDLERANRYLKKSVADATFYNARLRNVQASKMLPVIDRAYQLEKERQRQKLQSFLWIISVLSVFLLLLVGYIIRQMRKLDKARRDISRVNGELQKLNTELVESNSCQRRMNDSLQEANCIKEEYIGRFLGLCSTYIDKLETYRRMLNRKTASSKREELYETLKSSEFIEDELKEFYRNFDNSFLKIFPDFVAHFNDLLPESEAIVPRQGERLTTELRIFALIRLGITDSAKIAGFLRYSITTIYTYRSKMKNKSLHRDDFEERVMEIGSFKV